MSKNLSIDLAYDAPIAAVSGMLADAAFREEVCDAQHALSRSVAVTGSTVSIRYEQAVNGVPGFAKKLVGDTIEVHQDEIWSPDFVTGDLKLTLPGKPGSLSGTARLAENGAGTVETVSLTATVSVPLVSGKLEDLILSIFKKALEKEHQVGKRWLAG
ncbi:hypothetical protein J2S40_000603 [Nocardioides luteus]|uniref:DUF2505 domain-containing protein n=1 Tax=Nocardioides luteus TaxID=1844 RepID=A0ABQ5T2H2_9ACTN|nr:DUF2505 domain-containing protein [Nocardioides luteus]MDR7309545.1 hypothetical protein [Nocardioides luteus]GGR51977.1 hypothetical protein GCM10010197_17670 [Nocardioides luteus]GLJ70672.1 hypothetical protein GCM10017579_47080 [Nocardioides luteus]